MKVFWSWQSDTPGKTGRHFVRKAIKAAIADLNKEIVLDEPDREITLDQDRQGVPGSPDLVKTILTKISDSIVFLADVTPVGESWFKKEGEIKIKSLQNPNVAIELGYAFSELGDAKVLMVLNEYYGNREVLPFDLRHKAGPIIYNLAPEANKQEIEAEFKKLHKVLKRAIGDCIEAEISNLDENQTAQDEHTEIPSKNTPALFCDSDEVIADRGRFGGHGVSVSFNANEPLMYLRLIPTQAYPKLRRSEIKKDIIFGIKIHPMRRNFGSGACHEPNKYGGMTFSYREGEAENVFTVSQVFENREIWGIDSTVFDEDNIIRIGPCERIIQDATNEYVDAAIRLLDTSPPYYIESGFVNVEGFQMLIPDRYSDERFVIYDNVIASRQLIQTNKPKDINSALLGIFEELFDVVGEKRPINFRDFPESGSPTT